jgi:hypothetical protein
LEIVDKGIRLQRLAKASQIFAKQINWITPTMSAIALQSGRLPHCRDGQQLASSCEEQSVDPQT